MVTTNSIVVCSAGTAPNRQQRTITRARLQRGPGAAARSRDTYLAAQFWRLARRIGKKKAAVAVGHSILVIAWHLLDGDCDDAELGGDFFVRRDADRARQRAIAQLQALGYHVTLQPTAA